MCVLKNIRSNTEKVKKGTNLMKT